MNAKEKEKEKEILRNWLHNQVPEDFVYQLTPEGFTGKKEYIEDQIKKLEELISKNKKLLYIHFNSFKKY